MSTIKLDAKDPNEVDYRVLDWTNELDGATISSASVQDLTGATKDSESNTTTTHTIWFSGGTAGTECVFTSRIVTSDSRTLDQRCKMKIRSG